ncbi:MAG: MFS transporter [Chloroflexota bacterium]|nr:MAG: MFS transporter [Chloroflexota bacterium]
MSRKRVIIMADLLTGLATVALLILASAGQLLPWHIYLASALSGVFGTFHFLAFSTSITLMIPKAQYTRANSLLSLAHYSSVVAAPVLAGLLIAPIGISGVMLIDIFTFLFAVTTVSMVTIPGVLQSGDGDAKGWAAFSFGFRYIRSRRPLLGLMLVMFAFSLFESFGYPLIAPMVLARTGGDEVVLGLVQSVLGIGGIVGGAIVSVWGGFRQKVYGVLAGLLLTGLFGDALMGLGSGLPVWLPAAIFLELFIPLVISSNNAIWQSKVPPEQQGRVFAARSMVSGLGEPAAILCTGLLADKVFEPAMLPGGVLTPLLGGVLGTGPGAGMAVLLVICGLLSAAVAVWGYLAQPVREIETILPDHDG